MHSATIVVRRRTVMFILTDTINHHCLWHWYRGNSYWGRFFMLIIPGMPFCFIKIQNGKCIGPIQYMYVQYPNSSDTSTVTLHTCTVHAHLHGARMKICAMINVCIISMHNSTRRAAPCLNIRLVASPLIC